MLVSPATSAQEVRQVTVPAYARALSMLCRVDYEDAFRARLATAPDWTAEQWARALLEGAPASVRRALRRGWFALGLKLGSAHSERLVLGWEIRRTSPDFVLLGATSRCGLPAELLLQRQENFLLLITFVQHDNPIARPVSAAVQPIHRRVVPSLLKQRTRRISNEECDE